MSIRRTVTAALLFLITAGLVQQTPEAPPPTPNWMMEPELRGRDLSNLYNNSPLPPGLYQLRAENADKCVGMVPTWGAEVAHLVLVECTPDTVLAFIQNPFHNSAYTVRIPSLASDRGRYTHCVTRARGVLIGAQRLDVLPCETPANATSWRQAGEGDQIHFMPYENTGLFQIESGGWGPRRRCWDVRGSSMNVGADLLVFECHGRANQKFELIYVSPLSDEEMSFFRSEGWLAGPEGRPFRLANRLAGVDLPGSDYETGPSPNDGGAFCAASCTIDERCKAFTWAERGVAEERATCWLKDSYPPATHHARTASGYVQTWRGRRLAG